jgi:hypothetical protein
MERLESYHNLDIPGEVHLSHHKVLLGSFLRRTVGTGSCTQHSTGWSSMGGRRGNFQPGVVAGDRVAGVAHFERLLVAAFELLGSE